ncbi:MAG TPA: hypothetical protein ENH82_20105 [bacterium]|nr:hypothetical protein [bacterium]
MSHKYFHLHKRPSSKKGKYIYYVQFYDEYGDRLTAKSTGQTSKAAAENWSYEQLRKGLVFVNKKLTFNEYARDWWYWDRCQYIKRKIARNKRISREYADTNRSYLDTHIIPYFGKKILYKITPNMVETWLFSLREKIGKTGKLLSATTANCCLKTLRIMMDEAVRQEYISVSPAIGIEPLGETPKEKNILKIDEVRTLFRDDTIKQVWEENLLHFTINLLAASTGMRMGECQALRIVNVHDEYVSVVHGWSRKYGVKEPKYSSKRDIPIPRKTSNYLHSIIHTFPYQDPEELVFFGEDRAKPVSHRSILDWLYRALENIGISPGEREKRNVTFHSWRHFFNSYFRGKVPDPKLQAMTGHRSIQMTNHYTKFNIQDFRDVQEIQEECFQ